MSRPPANRFYFRLRGDLTVWRNQVGLMARFSTAFANYQLAIILVTSPDASVRLARLGLAYRFN